MPNQVHGTEAYDLSLFEPKPAKVVALPPNKKQIKLEKRRTKIQSAVNTVVTLLTSAVVVAILGLMIAGRVQLTEMSSEINQKKTEVNEIVGEIKRLESELAAQTSAQSLEQYAQENGLQKIEPGQIGYITVEDPEAPQDATESEPGFWESLWNTLTGFFTAG